MEKITLNSIGELKENSDFPGDLLISQPISIPFFDGKKVSFNFDGYSGDESFFAEADTAISNFLEKNEKDREEISNLVFENYRNFVDAVGEDENLPQIEYAKNIWHFVYPQEIYIARGDSPDGDIYLQIHCECEWEIEHGLQIVFKQGKKVTRVSYIDGHLTD